MPECQKTVLFVLHSLNIGGVEKAFLGVVNKFIHEGWEVHLALLKHYGGFLEYLPAEVQLHIIDEFAELKPIIHEPLRYSIINKLKNKKLKSAIKLAILWLLQKTTQSNLYLFKHLFQNVKPFGTQFDLAIAFAGPYPFIDYYVANRVEAKEKWGWVHFDISKFKVDELVIRDVYHCFSKINVVSQEGKGIFDKKFPEFKTKTLFTPNIVDVECIKAASEALLDLKKEQNQITICTVGRVSTEKGQYLALQSLATIVEKFPSVVWWFIGDGNDLKRCKEFVKNNDLERNVIFTGSRPNPYPYLKACDVYVQPSLYEGSCISVAEAKIFNKPIIATDFTGIKEHLSSYTNIYKVVKYDEAQLAEALLDTLSAFIKR